MKIWVPMRWVALVLAYFILPDLILAFYPPVGRVLGGYVGAWAYMIAYLMFAFVASFAGIFLVGVLAPSRRRIVALCCSAGYVLSACVRIAFPPNPLWPPWYSVVNMLVIVAGASLATFLPELIDAFAEAELALRE